MKKKYTKPDIAIIKFESDSNLLTGSGNTDYAVGDPSTPTTPSKPSGDGISGGIGAGGDNDQWSGQGAKKHNSWDFWND